ncbi:carboxypeptidase-like regulatory domain-containing protein, partial [Myxococcota bacterium]|nr:carboxypeptidase-like regulatory domain-containing protein [Myxococcota bacterium]
FTQEGFVRISSGRFKLGQIFGGRRWTGKVVDWRGEHPLYAAKVEWEGVKILTDEDGSFEAPAQGLRVVVSYEGYKSQSVTLGREGGEIIVKMISLRHWALFLLRRIFQLHAPDLAHSMTPREGIERQIPPPDVISRLEALAYGQEEPMEGELETLRISLGQSGSPDK